MADVSIAACSSEALETVSTVRISSNQWTKQPLAKALWVPKLLGSAYRDHQSRRTAAATCASATQT